MACDCLVFVLNFELGTDVSDHDVFALVSTFLLIDTWTQETHLSRHRSTTWTRISWTRTPWPLKPWGKSSRIMTVTNSSLPMALELNSLLMARSLMLFPWWVTAWKEPLLTLDSLTYQIIVRKIILKNWSFWTFRVNIIV